MRRTISSNTFRLLVAPAALVAGFASLCQADPAYMAPEGFFQIQRADTAASEFFHLLDFEGIPALEGVEDAVASDDVVASKVALLDYMRNRSSLWAQAMPGSVAPQYYFDRQTDLFKVRALLSFTTSEIGAIDASMNHLFTYTGSNCQLDPNDLDWLPVAGTNCTFGNNNAGAFAEQLSAWHWVQPLAFAYLETGDATYAEYLVNKVMVDFARDQPVPPSLTISNPWKSNSSVQRLRVLLDSYFSTLASSAMTPEAHFEILRLIWQHGQNFSAWLEYGGATGSDEMANMAAGLAMLAAVFPEFRSTASDAPDWQECGSTSGVRVFRGSDQWLTKSLQWFEATMVEGGYYLAAGFPTFYNAWTAPVFDESGWHHFYSTHYHKGLTRRAAEAFLLLSLNDVWSNPILSDDTKFALQHGPLGETLPLRHRAMINALFENTAPDNQTLNTGDGLLNDNSHIFALGVALYGDREWRSRVDSPPTLALLGVDGIEKFNGIDTDAEAFDSQLQAGSDFMMMHSDSVNRVASGSQMLFFDGNDTAHHEHSHEDIGQVQLFSHGHHMLIDPGVTNYAGPGADMHYHNVSMPLSWAYRYSDETLPNGAVVLDSTIHEFSSGHGLAVGVASVMDNTTTVVTRTVAYLPGDYSIVIDSYPATTESVLDAATFWHFDYQARSTAGTYPACTTTPEVSIRSSDKAAVAKFHSQQWATCGSTHDATLYILPLHPEEITSESIEDGENVIPLFGAIPTKRVIYEFSVPQSPVREQVLLPQSASDFALTPTLTSIPPDDDDPNDRGRHASGFDLAIGEDRRDVTLFNYVPPSAPREFGNGAFSSDAHVAHIRFEEGDLTRITIKDGREVVHGSTTLVSSLSLIEDIDVRFSGTTVNIHGNPTEISLSIHAPSTTVVHYNGNTHPFVQNGDYITVDLSHAATELFVGPTDPVHAWVGAIFEVELSARDNDDFVAADFDESVTISSSPSVEMSIDNFQTVTSNPDTITLQDGERTIYLRGTEASASAVAFEASYVGSYGTVASVSKSNLYIDSIETVPEAEVTTTLPAVSTTTTTSTTLPDVDPEEIFYDGFEDPVFRSEWTNSGAQVWDGSGGTSFEGDQSARFNNTDSLILSLSLCGYRDIDVTWSRHTRQRDSGDKLKLSWSSDGGTTWNLLQSANGNVAWGTSSFDLPAAADHNADFKLKVHTENTGSSELGFIDEIFVRGQPCASQH